MNAGDEAVVRETVTVPVVEERVTVDKRRVDVGAVRLRKVVHHDSVTVDEPLEVETVDVERVPIGRVVEGPVAVRHEGDVMIVPVVEERLVTVVQRVLVEEIRIRSTRRIEPSTQQVRLRREQVVVERLDAASGEWRAVEGDAAAATDPHSTHDPPAAA